MYIRVFIRLPLSEFLRVKFHSRDRQSARERRVTRTFRSYRVLDSLCASNRIQFKTVDATEIPALTLRVTPVIFVPKQHCKVYITRNIHVHC